MLAHPRAPATLPATYAWLHGQWLPKSGEELRDSPPIEVYLSDPRTTPLDQMRTDVRLTLT